MRILDRFFAISRPKKRMVSVLADVCILLVSLWGAYALRLEDPSWFPTSKLAGVFLVTISCTILVFIKFGLYRAVIRYISEKAFLVIVGGAVFSGVCLIVSGFLLQAYVPRSIPVIYGAMAFLLISGTRFGIRALVNHPRQSSKQRVLVVGAGATGMQLASALEQGIEYRPVAFVSMKDSNHKSLIAGLPVYGLPHIEKAFVENRVDRVLLALDESNESDRKELLNRLERMSVPVQTVPSMSELVAGQARINDIRDLALEDLLGRAPVSTSADSVSHCLSQKSVMVTGAGGSIGSELCRQILRHRPSKLLLFERSEFSLYSIERELQEINRVEALGVELYPLLGDVTHSSHCEMVMKTFEVQTVYHAAAYKHVPLVEHNVIEGVQNNVFGTLHMAEAAIAAGVERFVLISTDKAVRPTNVMGASKRMAELILQGLAQQQIITSFSMVRFGNVLGSSGSVVPLFRDQIRDGGPVTVTHPDIIRYFMTIPEASQLVLQAGSMGRSGEVFVLDMGKPVKIADLARKMIHLMGMTELTPENPNGEIEVIFTGLRPGEKLYEELLVGHNPQGTSHPRIMMAREASMSTQDLDATLKHLMRASREFDCKRVVEILHEAPTGFAPNGSLADLVWCNRENFQAAVTLDVDNVRQLPS